MSMQLQPLAGCSFRTFLKLLLENRGVDFKYLLRALLIFCISAVTGLARTLERARFRKKLETLQIQEDPIFIIGHWRSGTTLLHTLMSQDPQFGYISNYQACVPELSLADRPFARWFVAKSLPRTRPMDSMALSLESPQEEEYALANLGLHSFYHGWSFPRGMKEYFEKVILFKGIVPFRVERWKKVYLKLIKIATYGNGGKRLVLKNPSNTARIKVLLELFPNAKFIHIYRNPYIVYLSTQNLYRKLLPFHTFQSFDWKEIDENILLLYEQLMQKFLEDKSLIPAQNLVEMRYEDLEADPMEEIERIYEKFGLPFNEAYVSSQTSYRKNQYHFDAAVIEQVSSRWQFAIDHWKYQVPNSKIATTGGAKR
jgi:omega-hydroxy-beta-dihydromenaquinone-9 sulfotransferase